MLTSFFDVVDIDTEAAGLYMYTSDSPFAFLDMNNYMTLGRAISPVTSESEYLASLGNGSSKASFVVGNSSRPVNLTVASIYISLSNRDF